MYVILKEQNENSTMVLEWDGVNAARQMTIYSINQCWEGEDSRRIVKYQKKLKRQINISQYMDHVDLTFFAWIYIFTRPLTKKDMYGRLYI